MRRLYIFVIPALLLTGGSSLVLAQRGSGGHSSVGHSVGSGSHSVASSGFRSTSSTLRSPSRSIYPITSVPIGATGINPGALSHGPYRTGRGGVGFRGGYGYAGYGYYPYYPLFDDYNDSSYYNNGYYNSAPQPAYEEPDSSAGALGEQIDRLSAEVAALRQQGYAASAPRPRYSAPPMMTDDQASSAVPVTLILRDGKQLQLKSYAVMGQEIWDFSSQPAKKIALANVNLEASQKATESAGGEFPDLHPPAAE